MSTHAAPVTLDSRLTDYLYRDEVAIGRHAQLWTVGDVWPVYISRTDALDLATAKLHEVGRKLNRNAVTAERRALQALIFN